MTRELEESTVRTFTKMKSSIEKWISSILTPPRDGKSIATPICPTIIWRTCSPEAVPDGEKSGPHGEPYRSCRMTKPDWRDGSFENI